MSRFTEHQFDKLRHGNPDLAAPPEPEFRAPPPASYRRYAGEDLDNTVGHVSRQLCHVSCYVRRVSAMSPPQDALAFGRPGCGAPQRTKSGRIRTAIFGNPEIRFQANESVKKTINNNIRCPLYLY